MSFNSTIRLVVLTSAVALAATAPAAFAARAATSLGGFYTEAQGTPDAPAATFSRQVTEKKIVASSAAAAPAGKWVGNFYTQPNATPDAPSATYSRQVIDKHVAPSTSTNTGSLVSVPAY